MQSPSRGRRQWPIGSTRATSHGSVTPRCDDRVEPSSSVGLRLTWLLLSVLRTRCDDRAVTSRIHRSLDPEHMYPAAAIQQPRNTFSTDEDLHQRH